MGYAGGTKKSPTYHDMGDHTETFQVDYDPTQVTYAELLRLFWQSHNPGRKPWSRQYMAAIFWHNDEQKREALESKAALEKQGVDVQTVLAPLTEFTWAEDYHQKYVLRADPVLGPELLKLYPRPKDFVNSTLAARLNGLLGEGARKISPHELDSFGLSPEARRRLHRYVDGSLQGKPACKS